MLVGILSGIDLLSVVFILVALFTGFWVELFLFTFLFFIYFCLEPHLFLIKFESYKITIHSEEHSISVSLVSRNSKNSMMVLSQERLHSISAGPNTSIYQLNICCYNFSKAVHITGNHAEVQWLCDKLNKWTGLNIKYQDTTPTF